jgi:hypothetical protein
MSLFDSLGDVIGAKLILPIVGALIISMGVNYAEYKTIQYYRAQYIKMEQRCDEYKNVADVAEGRLQETYRQCNRVIDYYEKLPKPKKDPIDIMPDDVDIFLRGMRNLQDDNTGSPTTAK